MKQEQGQGLTGYMIALAVVALGGIAIYTVFAPIISQMFAGLHAAGF